MKYRIYGNANNLIYSYPTSVLNKIFKKTFEKIKMNKDEIKPIEIEINNDFLKSLLLWLYFFWWYSLDNEGNNIKEILLIKKLGRNKIGFT